jgi:hypothetical protein
MASQFRRKPRASPHPVDANPEVKRRLSRLVYFGGALALAMITLNLMPINSEPWVWIKLVILAAGTTIFAIWATRFSLWQRDEYWRERGRDPKHPDRFPDRSDEN